MATNTYVALQSVTLTTAVASITLGTGGTISQAYTDLVLVINGAGNGGGGGNIGIRINGDTTASYTSATRVLGDGSAASSARAVSGSYGYVQVGDAASGERFAVQVNFPSYTNTSIFRTTLSRSSSTSYVSAYTGLYSNPSKAAITQIDAIIIGQNFAIGTTATLYGIAAEGAGYATGGYITSDATYYYHAFTSSGTFIPSKNLTADILVVAGGGAGGSQYAGGGGAGGVAYQAARSLSNGTSYTCTVGAGGAALSSYGQGSAGSNTVFDTITTNGGGGGGYWNGSGTNGSNGGSGGGGGMGTSSGNTTSGGSATQGNSGGATGYGNAGGGGLRSGSYFLGGGGGGAGTVGGNAFDGVHAGAGGDGLNTWSSILSATGLGVSGYIAGGGGGAAETGTYGAGGAGGGGAGGQYPSSNTGVAGAANTGSGGGGAAGNTTSGSGGSGLIIVRYAK